MDRRRFLSIVTLGAAATTTTGFSFWSREASQNTNAVQEKLLRQLEGLESPCRSNADSLGQSYLQATPSEKDVDVLFQSIASACGRRGQDDMPREAHLRDQIRSDFENGRTELVDGWVLSRTEARLYALSFLS